MNITKARLKEIIQEELERMGGGQERLYQPGEESAEPRVAEVERQIEELAARIAALDPRDPQTVLAMAKISQEIDELGMEHAELTGL